MNIFIQSENMVLGLVLYAGITTTIESKADDFASSPILPDSAKSPGISV